MKDKYIITETVEEQLKVLNLLEKLGYIWPTKKKPTQLVPLYDYGDDTVLYLEPDKIISYSDEEYLLEIKDECEEISYEELLRQNKKVIL